ncbi:hypothetical protein HPB52_019235 [Rhipicephalus sanguineus]|uniref:Uncharacterized protein n=1 Tax=Rhipicephalus sanguineus TaxID=34632 RepID=A0A9D4Q8Z4_RHISA|nr:hypothetical protein HPB52_019235 [Rhipicephalus sanguineus]
MGRTLSILITFAHGPVPHTIRYMSVVHRCTQYKGSLDACNELSPTGPQIRPCAPIPKVASAHGAETSMNGRCSLLYPKLHSLWGPAPHGHRIVQGEKSHRKRHSPPLQKTKFFTKEDFPPLDKTYPSTSAWSSGPPGRTARHPKTRK